MMRDAEEAPGTALEYLRRIDERVERMQRDTDKLSAAVSSVRIDVVDLKRQHDRFSQLFSRLTDRLERIEKRLALPRTS